MGWSETKQGMWGDASQDLVNDYLDEVLGDKVDVTEPLWWEDEKRSWRDKLRRSKRLRTKFDDVFAEALNRRATQKEFNHHIDIAVGFSRTGVGAS